MVFGLRFINHWSVAPVRVDPKLLHMQTSWYWRGIDVVHINCLYWATCSVGSVIPEYFGVNDGILYFLGTSTRAISSTKGDAWNPVRGSTSTGTADPGNFARSDKTHSFCSSDIFNRWAMDRSDEQNIRRVVRKLWLLHCLEKIVSAWLEWRSRGYASADLVDLVQGWKSLVVPKILELGYTSEALRESEVVDHSKV